MSVGFNVSLDTQ